MKAVIMTVWSRNVIAALLWKTVKYFICQGILKCFLESVSCYGVIRHIKFNVTHVNMYTLL